jgi:hypothetical protein
VLIAQLVAELRVLNAHHARERGSVSPSAIEALVRALADAVAHRAFTSREAIAHGQHVDPALRMALANAGIENARQLGKLLRRIEDTPIGGYVVTALDDGPPDRDGLVWVLRVASIAATLA